MIIPHRRKAELEFNPSRSEVTVLTLQIMGNFKVYTLNAHKHLMNMEAFFFKF